MSSSGLSMFEFVNKTMVVVATSVFCGLAILCNLFMVIVILFSSKLRTSPKHIVILTLCIVDLYEGVAIFPLIAEYQSLETWNHDIGYLRYSDFSQWLLLSSFRILLSVIICTVTLTSMLTENKRVLMLLSVSMIFAAILSSLVLVLPGTENKDYDLSENCFWDVRKFVSSAANFPHDVILVVCIIDVFIVSVCSRSFGVNIDGSRRFPVDVLIGSIVMLVFNLPHQIVGAYFSSCSGSDQCQTMHIVRNVTVQWANARYFIQPMVWILCEDVRRSLSHLCCTKSQTETPNSYAVPMKEQRL